MTTAIPENLRLFYALWPDQATRAALMRLQSGLAGRRIAPGNLHLTLAFLGMQPSALLPQLAGALDSTSGALSAWLKALPAELV